MWVTLASNPRCWWTQTHLVFDFISSCFIWRARAFSAFPLISPSAADGHRGLNSWDSTLEKLLLRSRKQKDVRGWSSAMIVTTGTRGQRVAEAALCLRLLKTLGLVVPISCCLACSHSSTRAESPGSSPKHSHTQGHTLSVAVFFEG